MGAAWRFFFIPVSCCCCCVQADERKNGKEKRESEKYVNKCLVEIIPPGWMNKCSALFHSIHEALPEALTGAKWLSKPEKVFVSRMLPRIEKKTRGRYSLKAFQSSVQLRHVADKLPPLTFFASSNKSLRKPRNSSFSIDPLLSFFNQASVCCCSRRGWDE